MRKDEFMPPAAAEMRKTRNRGLACPNEIAEQSVRYLDGLDQEAAVRRAGRPGRRSPEAAPRPVQSRRGLHPHLRGQQGSDVLRHLPGPRNAGRIRRLRFLEDLKSSVLDLIALCNEKEAKPFNWTVDPGRLVASRGRGTI